MSPPVPGSIFLTCGAISSSRTRAGTARVPEEGPCHAGADEHGDTSTWLDIWIGGEGESEAFADDCTEQVTGVRAAVFHPADNFVVASGEGVIHDGTCDSGYGNQLITTTPAR